MPTGSGSSRSEIDALRDLVEWYVQAGVDVALDDAPHDRFAEGAAEQIGRAHV